MTSETQDQPANVAPPETKGGSAATIGSAIDRKRRFAWQLVIIAGCIVAQLAGMHEAIHTLIVIFLADQALHWPNGRDQR